MYGDSMNVTLDSCPSRHTEVFSRFVDGEAVLLLPAKGEVKVVNEVGAQIWESIDGKHTVREIVALICAEYQVERADAERDVIEFLESLLEHGIVTISSIPDQSSDG